MLKFPGGKTRALTFSYDDGIYQDMRLVQLFNLYGLKCTFNLNSGIQNNDHTWLNKDVLVRRMPKEILPDLYKGHEVAVHTLTHPRLYDLPDEQLAYELKQDRENLEELFGQPMVGMAYPFGDCDERIMKAVADAGLLYGRTTKTTGTFALPEDPLAWKATCHHKDENLIPYVDEFLAEGDDLRLFYIWGHSYEFDVERNWQNIENFCKKIAGRDDVWYCTNGEFVLWMKENGLI
ncbi:MAG: polysaccharide deacetylase family protein [Oscillospiraceae bacterium]|nr:polysaccharide deacetylase family protein [Oscillospiraceae bacterium]